MNVGQASIESKVGAKLCAHVEVKLVIVVLDTVKVPETNVQRRDGCIDRVVNVSPDAVASETLTVEHEICIVSNTD